MKTLSQIEHIRKNPQMYWPDYQGSGSILEMIWQFFSKLHVAENSARFNVELAENHLNIRTAGAAITFEVMRNISRAFYSGMGCTEEKELNLNQLSLMLMALCREAELTSFCDGSKLTVRSMDEARCGEETPTGEADGIELRLTFDNPFNPADVNEKLLEYHTLYPETEIWINGKLL